MAYSAYECLTLEQMLDRVKKSDPEGKGCALIERAYHFADIPSLSLKVFY